MHTIKRFFVLFLLVFLTGCASTAIQRASEDTFIIYKEDHRGIFGSKKSFIDGVINEAQDFAKSKGGMAVEIASFYTGPGLGQWATFKYEFRIANSNIKLDKTAIDNMYSRCLIEKVADYDDGSDVNIIAKVVTNKCKKECVYEPMKVYNLSSNSEEKLRSSCLERATDTIFQVRYIKRNDGDVKRFGNILYVKRRGDAHHKMLLSIFDVTSKIEFNFNCQKGAYSNSVDMHNIELTGAELYGILGLKKDVDTANLNINGKNIYFLSEDKERERLTLPNANLADFFSPTEKIVVSNDQNIIEFSTAGYRDAINSIITECSFITTQI